MDRLNEIQARKAEIKAILESNEEANLEELRKELDSLDAEVRSINEAVEIEERKAQEEAKEQRDIAQKINEGEIIAEEIERKEDNKMNEFETRANEFAESGKLSMRSVLSTGNIAKPTKAGGVEELAEVASSIVDDVHAIALTGAGAWTVGYKASDAIAADVTDGSAIGGTASTYNYVTIDPVEVGVFDEISKQVKKMTSVDYMAAVEKTALIALRAKMAGKIVANLLDSSSLAEKKNGVTIDADYLKNVVLGFRSIETKGATCLYLTQADLLALGKVRGTNEKKPLYTIAFDNGTLTQGVISEGGLATKFRVLDSLTNGTQLFGQPMAIDMPMWDNYEISTDEGGEFFKKNMIGVRGIQTANAKLVAYHGMQVIKQAAE